MDATLTDRAYRGLRQKLASGELRAGQRIVNRAVAKQLNVSQTPLREAMHRLASEGILEYIPGAGAYVRKIELQDLLQLYDVREQLEPFAAARAAQHATEGEILEMQSICDDWRRIAREIRDSGRPAASVEEMLRWNDNEERFHTLLLGASRNRWLITVVRNLRLLSIAFAVQSENPQLLKVHAAAVTWREHVRIVRAIKRRDAASAERILRQHISNGRTYIINSLNGDARM